ncbi:MAG: potassium-transporting ATPase subunit KdpA [Acidobacteriaceae bacterium]|nr:potassium-transporting ATPase subunit KdpA [Acidobacteriaceae bacterium]MBV9781915.1 potassium-transporting ATPase subunit KdpA [Acidobacteriaceae bacterium]
MTGNGVFQIAIYFLVILALTKPMGVFMARLFEGKRTFLHPALRWLETFTYKLTGVNESTEQRWTQYTASLLAFSIFSFLFVYVLQRLQGVLPLNPQGFKNSLVSPDLAFNTAVSFVTNTNWQSYAGGESTLSYFVQMAALTVQNFGSAAAGIAVALALTRGFARQQVNSLGNFWVDLTRSVVYILLPVSFLAALFFCSQGVIQNLHPYTVAQTMEGAKQILAQGPVASQEAIKMLGTNGGGFFGANSAHPFENPTPLANFLQLLLIFVIPAGLTYMFGVIIGDRRQGWTIFSACAFMFLVGVFCCYWAEQRGNPTLAKLGIETNATIAQTGGNMEGKEIRFGIASSALFATVTTDASCGAVNGMHDSFTPLGGLIPLFNIQTGEVIFGGVGAGLYGILLYAIVAVFIAGLMVGRTPEYVGKKIEQKEVKMAMLALIVTAFSILVFAAVSSIIQFPSPTKDAKGQPVAQSYWNPPGPATANLANSGPHGFSEILYAYTSGTGNNGSAFGGINANTPWYNLTIGLAMLMGRFLFLIPLLAVAGSLAMKKKVGETLGTLPTHGPLFVGLLVGTVMLVGALTFFPALALGPIVEHYLMQNGKLFSVLLFAIGS